MGGHITLIQRIATLHVVYQMNKSRVLWFGQLVSHSPGIIVYLKNENKFCDTKEMVIAINSLALVFL